MIIFCWSQAIRSSLKHFHDAKSQLHFSTYLNHFQNGVASPYQNTSIVVVAQLAEWSHPKPEVHGMNPVICKIVSCQMYWKDKNILKEAGNGQLMENLSLCGPCLVGIFNSITIWLWDSTRPFNKAFFLLLGWHSLWPSGASSWSVTTRWPRRTAPCTDATLSSSRPTVSAPRAIRYCVYFQLTVLWKKCLERIIQGRTASGMRTRNWWCKNWARSRSYKDFTA